MLFKASIGIIMGLAVALAFQTWQLERCQIKAKALEVCQEIDTIEGEVRNETDDNLIDRISRP